MRRSAQLIAEMLLRTGKCELCEMCMDCSCMHCGCMESHISTELSDAMKTPSAC